MKIRGIFARLHVIGHKLRHPSHVIFWRLMNDNICDGDIVCDTCQRNYWCRFQDLSHKEQDKRIRSKRL